MIAGLVASLRAETYGQVAVRAGARPLHGRHGAALARAAIGGDARFEIVEIDACPSEWAGKVHAVHAGVTRSRGAADADFLLFADADTLFSPGCIASALALMRERKLDLPEPPQHADARHLVRARRPDRRGAGADAAFSADAGERRRRPPPRVRQRPVHAVPPRAYDAIGGHEAVKDALLEDLALARRVDDGTRRLGLFMADGLFHCRMYADWPQFRRGWKRIYTEAASRRAEAARGVEHTAAGGSARCCRSGHWLRSRWAR